MHWLRVPTLIESESNGSNFTDGFLAGFVVDRAVLGAIWKFTTLEILSVVRKHRK